MSLPSFPRPPSPAVPSPFPSGTANDNPLDTSSGTSLGPSKGPGAGNLLPRPLLIICAISAILATSISFFSITLQLKQYRRPSLQRAVVRIMIMVPLYSLASLIALFSLDAAFFIDAVRDLYEAFVIYTFLQLLITYLGGERSLLILLHGREPIQHPFPMNLFLQPMDVSDPWVLLNLKRGVLQYVQIKPLLVLATVILKLTDTYREGALRFDAGYTYVSIVYNASICLSLYCLAMFWVAVNRDLKPFRPVPKFLCVKGILFFSFWQGLAVSFLVAVHAIKRLGAYTDAEHMSLALTDSLLCLEMPFFAIAHQYAFRASDYIDHNLTYAARMPFLYAVKDAFGVKDVWLDIKSTLKGRGISYQAYEPAEGGVHVGQGRQRRIKAGLRYSSGGKKKYWLPQAGDESYGRGNNGPLVSIKRKIQERRALNEGYAPLLPNQAARIYRQDSQRDYRDYDSDSDESDAPSLDFDHVGPADSWEENAYARAKKIEYVGYPNIDVSKEEANRKLWEDEQGILAGKWSRRDGGRQRTRSDASKGKGKGKGKANGQAKAAGVYGKWADRDVSNMNASGSSRKPPSNGDTKDPQNLDQVLFELPEDEADVEAWLYDGEVEREAADGPDETRLRWTKKATNGSRNSDTPQDLEEPTPPKSPFAIGLADDGVSDPEEEESVEKTDRPLPFDAVDLVVEDHEAIEEAVERERRRGEPAVHLPKHVYKRGWISPNGEQRENTVQVYEDGEQRREEHGEGGRKESMVNGNGRPEDLGVTTLTEAPEHALLEVDRDEDNPWH